MNKLKNVTVLGLSVIAVSPIFGQDKGTFGKSNSKYYLEEIMGGINEYEAEKETEEVHKRFQLDFSNSKYPTDPSKYTSIWAAPRISQGNTGTCWCFSTTSFYESEVQRISGKEVDLSEMYTVYWEYVERAKYFVDNRGDMTLGEGSETNAVARMMELYGVVPTSSYTGKLDGQSFHNHEGMFEEINGYLDGVKKSNAWDKQRVVATVKSILEHYMGPVPTSVEVNGKAMTPKGYMKHLGIVPGDYVNFMSLMEEPYWKMAEYDVPDNWWNSEGYHNVPLDEFNDLIKSSIKKGFGISIGGDVSEPGFDKTEQVAVIPSFDVPSDQINENSRQMRFSNGATTDDHAMHLVGYQEVEGATWYLVKDSGSGSRNCGEKSDKFGYYFMHEDYVKLKIMSFTIHKDAVKDVLGKF